MNLTSYIKILVKKERKEEKNKQINKQTKRKKTSNHLQTFLTAKLVEANVRPFRQCKFFYKASDTED
jgi:hypothetical protein